MAYYNYKYVRDRLPPFIIAEMGPDYEGSCDYDGDQWIAADNYIAHLQDVITKLIPNYDFSEPEGK